MCCLHYHRRRPIRIRFLILVAALLKLTEDQAQALVEQMERLPRMRTDKGTFSFNDVKNQPNTNGQLSTVIETFVELECGPRMLPPITEVSKMYSAPWAIDSTCNDRMSLSPHHAPTVRRTHCSDTKTPMEVCIDNDMARFKRQMCSENHFQYGDKPMT
jgi:hypothetical protein